jgi:hypothetical protein
MELRCTPAHGRGVYATHAILPGSPLPALSSTALAAVVSPASGRCAQCGSLPGAGPPLRGCPACGTRYCGRACQSADWPLHRGAECAALAAARGKGRAFPASLRLVARALRAAAAAPAPAAAPPAEGALDGALAAALKGPAGLLALAHNLERHGAAALEEFGALAPALAQLGVGGGGAPASGAAEVLRMFARARCAAFSMADAELRPWGVGFFPLGGALNHSCAPNCAALFSAGRGGGGGGGPAQAFRTVAPVAAGEQLTVAYVDVGLPTHLRRAALRAGYFFECGCPACAHYDGGGGGAAPLLLEEAAGAAGEGGGAEAGPPPPRWRHAAALSPRDSELLSLRCAGEGCSGAVVALLPPGGGGEEAVAPPDAVYALPCARCGSRLPRDRARALRGLYAAAAPPPVGDVARARAALALARRLLGPRHHLLAALAACAAHAEVGVGEWERAAAANALALPALRFAYPAGHVLPGLHLAMAGKLAHAADAPREAAAHLRAALAALAAPLGGDHELCRDLAARLHAAGAEAEAGEAGDEEAAGRRREPLARLLP